jgi:hypothetical protein
MLDLGRPSQPKQSDDGEAEREHLVAAPTTAQFRGQIVNLAAGQVWDLDLERHQRHGDSEDAIGERQRPA